MHGCLPPGDAMAPATRCIHSRDHEHKVVKVFSRGCAERCSQKSTRFLSCAEKSTRFLSGWAHVDKDICVLTCVCVHIYFLAGIIPLFLRNDLALGIWERYFKTSVPDLMSNACPTGCSAFCSAFCSAAECVPARGSRGTAGLFPVPGIQGMA